MKPFILFLLILTLCSCDVYIFENAQPLDTKELKEIPSELIGTYIEKSEQDTLVITSHSYSYLASNTKSFQEFQKDGTLGSGKVVLKKANGYYILSQKITFPEESSFDNLWEVYALKNKGKRLFVYSLSYIEDEGEHFTDSLMNVLPIKEQAVDGDTIHVLNPTKREFKTLLESKLYRKVLEFKKIK